MILLKTYKKPIIGVFVSNHHINKLHSKLDRFKSSSRYIRYIELAKANNEAKTTLYFFSSNDVDFRKNIVRGTYYVDKKGIWRKKNFSFPDVLYDRGGGGDKNSIIIRKKLKKIGTKKINAQHFFNKWDLYKKLKKVNEIRPYLPVTVKGFHSNLLPKLLESNDNVYIKACRGSLGKTVIRLERLGQEGYQFKYFKRGKVIVEEAKNIRELSDKLSSFFKNKEVIMQQAIELPVINNSIVDMRSEVQRNEKGKIEISGITVRIGRPNSPIASNTENSQYYPFETFFKKHLNYSLEEISELEKKIARFLYKVYQSVELSYGKFGDIGIDFALDNKGKLWLIECNAKSAKVALYKANEHKNIRKAFLNILLYAKYISNKK